MTATPEKEKGAAVGEGDGEMDGSPSVERQQIAGTASHVYSRSTDETA